MSTPAKIKVAVKIKTLNTELTDSHLLDTRNSSLNMDKVKNLYTSDTYFRTSIALINKINAQFGWPRGILPIKEYENNFSKIMNFIVREYTIYRKEALSAKYSAILCPLKIAGYDGPLMDMRKELESINIPDKQLGGDPQSVSWSQLVQVLEDNYKKSKHPGGRIVAAAYINGYLISLADIVNTRVDPDSANDHECNFLDLDNGVWIIRGDINKHKQAQRFNVSDDFIHTVKGMLRKGSTWLISKKAGQPYRSAVALKHLDLSGFTIKQLRSAYTHAHSHEFNE